MNLVLLGAPGAGKGTVAQELVAEFGVAHISTGDLLRAAVKGGTELGIQAKKYMDAGELVPDQLVIDLVKERLAADDAQQGFILDGFPRNTAQAVTLDSELSAMGREIDCALLVDVAPEVIIDRLSSRRTCRACGYTGTACRCPLPQVRRRDVSARRRQARDHQEPSRRLREVHEPARRLLSWPGSAQVGQRRPGSRDCVRGCQRGSRSMIKIKSATQIEQMKKAGALSKMALRHVGAMVRPGVSTFELDQLAEQIIRMHGGTPAFKGYGGFPGTICASINDAVVHGIPNPDMILRDGDIISIDTGAVVDGWVGDNAWTFFVGTPTPEAKALCEVTRDCLKAAIEQAVPGNHIGDVGYAVQSLAESHGYGVLRDYVGHGIGRVMHEDPSVPNYGKKGRGVRLQAGMVIAIEPMVTMGSNHVSTGSDGWIVTTNDHLPAAHYENTVAITNDGPVILTTDAQGSWCSLQGGEM